MYMYSTSKYTYNYKTIFFDNFLITASNAIISKYYMTPVPYIEILKLASILNNFKKNSVLVGELIIIGPSLTVTWTMYMYVHIH